MLSFTITRKGVLSPRPDSNRLTAPWLTPESFASCSCEKPRNSRTRRTCLPNSAIHFRHAFSSDDPCSRRGMVAHHTSDGIDEPGTDVAVRILFRMELLVSPMRASNIVSRCLQVVTARDARARCTTPADWSPASYDPRDVHLVGSVRAPRPPVPRPACSQVPG